MYEHERRDNVIKDLVSIKKKKRVCNHRFFEEEFTEVKLGGKGIKTEKIWKKKEKKREEEMYEDFGWEFQEYFE